VLRRSLIAFLLLLPAGLLTSEALPLQFDWALVKRAPNGAPRAINFSEKVAISPGDFFKICIRPLKNAFIYLFLDDASGNLQILFPDRFADFESSSYLNAQKFIPAGEDWFALDSTRGTERFYLVASTTRLSSLEDLTMRYQKSARGTNAGARQGVLDEISRLRRVHSQLSIAAEIPVTIAGGTRGVNEAAAQLATEIDAEGFYTKTFRLDH
jgi:hypothetical protein